MKHIFRISRVILLIILIQSCIKEKSTPPVITTTTATAVSYTTATSGGEVTSEGGASVTARGVCWGTVTNPTTANNKTTDGTGTGSFVSNLISLQPGTIYYVRSYATNSLGTSYGNEISFTTIATVPTLITTAATLITGTSATSGGNVTSDGGSAVTARGVCWATTSTPTTSNSKTTDGTGTGSFASSITGLTPGVTYYIRAYATNIIGTTYGDQVTTTTMVIIPTITTNVVSAITATSAECGGTITSDGGATVTERGVYWGTTVNPETAGTKLKIDATTNAFSVTIPNINPSTTYYVKAYAINSKGTAYGTLVSFKTSELQLAIIDVSQETEWDYWVIAKDGSNYFVTLNNNRPVSVYFKPDINKNGYVIFFDEKGLPSKMVIENYIFLFGNYRDQLVDIAVITPSGDISFQRDLKVNIDLT